MDHGGDEHVRHLRRDAGRRPRHLVRTRGGNTRARPRHRDHAGRDRGDPRFETGTDLRADGRHREREIDRGAGREVAAEGGLSLHDHALQTGRSD